jgi:hypothetical protein
VAAKAEAPHVWETEVPSVPSTVHIHVESEARFFSEGPDFLELCRLPLEAGQKYLVQASGIAGVDAGVMMRLKLDVCGRAGNVIASQQADYINDHQQFLLVVAARIPARGGAGSGPGPSANLSVRSFWPTPPSPGRSVYTNEMTIVAQTVDKIVRA